MPNPRLSRTERRKKERTLAAILYILAIAAMFSLILLIFGVWWFMMPPTITQDENNNFNNNYIEMREQIKEDVQYLAGSIGERNMHTSGTMDSAKSYISQRFKSIGYDVEDHQYTLQRGIYSGRTASNLIAEIPGSTRASEIIIIGAHYDTVPNSPGANDNASGVAVLLATAEQLKELSPERTVRFVAFANEEPPFFQTSDMGSFAYAKRSSERGESITGMIALDGLGYFDDSDGSQSYPLPGLGFAYSKSASFIALVTRLGDYSLLREVSASFKESGAIATESASLPGFLPGVNWSDHWAFWQHDYPGLLITDTLPFRDPHYHSPEDKPDRLNYENMARITSALTLTIQNLADSDE